VPVQIVLATHNAAKLAELRRILDAAGVSGIELLSAADVALPDVEETGTTFAANALLKARAGAQASGLACLSDDSGLTVDALGGAPGVRSARYAGAHGDDAANLAKVLADTAQATNRRARFVCVAALVTPQGQQHTALGILEGSLTMAPRGDGGFGYDPIFVPDGDTRTTAELSPSEKDAISHRGKAFRAIVPAIAAYAAAQAGS
jgi:XTP/dITP diphosphohydrolase